MKQMMKIWKSIGKELLQTDYSAQRLSCSIVLLLYKKTMPHHIAWDGITWFGGQSNRCVSNAKVYAKIDCPNNVI